MATVVVNLSANVDSVNLYDNFSRESDRVIYINDILPVAYTCTLTTRTSDTAGVVTLSSAGHGIVPGYHIGLIFANGAMRYHASVSAVNGAAITFSAGYAGGDQFSAVLPAQGTAGTCGNVVELPFDLTAASPNLVIVAADRICHLAFMRSDDTAIAVCTLFGTADATDAFYYAVNKGLPAILSDVTKKIWVSSFDTATEMTLKGLGVA